MTRVSLTFCLPFGGEIEASGESFASHPRTWRLAMQGLSRVGADQQVLVQPLRAEE
jgi:hypothetical protein